MAESFGFDAQEWELGQANIALARAQAGAAEETTKQENIKTRLALQAYASQREIQETLKQIGPAITKMAGSDPATAMANLAGVFTSAGMPEQAAEILGKAATAGKDSAAAAKYRLDREAKAAGYMGNAFAGVQDAAGWSAAAASLMQAYPEEYEDLIGIATMPMGQENFDYAGEAARISRAAMTQVDAAKKQQAEASAQHSRALAAESGVRTRDLIPSQVAVNKARAAYIEKEGGKPTAAQLATRTDAKNLIQSQYSVLDEDQAGVLALKLTDAAEDIKRDNPILTRTEALNQAFKAGQRGGMFAGLRPKMKGAGSSQKNPLPMPEDKEDLLPNLFYQDRTGKSWLWDEPSGTFVSPSESADREPEEESPEPEEEY